MNRLDAIEARAKAATPELGRDTKHPLDLRAYWVMDGGSREVGDFLYPVHDDVVDLLAVARAARLVKAQCDDMCPSWYDEPCDCGMAALREALAPLLEPEP